MTNTAYKKIVVAVDGSATSDLALAEAIRIAGTGGAQVLVLYVVDNGQLMFDVEYYDPTPVLQALADSGERALAAAAQRLSAQGVPHETRLVTQQAVGGDIASAVNDAAAEWGADLIVIGTHGRRGVRRLVLGSVAESVIRQASVPVLLVRGQAAQG
ncbi:universal stress protein [Cupriavidus basilensis]|uniref:Universal stress protein n=1 Tax=Cupriavidus basilensis TaxID=68895 RepID=A0A0C4YEP0_9BURK|nr:universal stress protein [Cupriavidus basilensis]AJG21298.1 Universal stress protein UspA-related nucleotide-binding protein [Cupriavidus basilensis]